jgi:hypothetical protein
MFYTYLGSGLGGTLTITGISTNCVFVFGFNSSKHGHITLNHAGIKKYIVTSTISRIAIIGRPTITNILTDI